MRVVNHEGSVWCVWRCVGEHTEVSRLDGMCLPLAKHFAASLRSAWLPSDQHCNRTIVWGQKSKILSSC